MIETKLEKMKEASGMTCTEIALAADLPEATVRKVLTGRTPDPRYDTLYRIVTAMGYTMNDLVEFDVKIDCEEESEECIKMLKRFLRTVCASCTPITPDISGRLKETK